MRIAVAADSESEESRVSGVGGRAPYYLIFEDKKLVKAMENPHTTGGGAGVRTAEMLKGEGVALVISGEIGPNMQASLDKEGIKTRKIENVEGKTVKQAVEEATGAD
ncbi:MAG: NifB/NifX family molybdenum-iron cluster-binding protein [Candidatus Woesearchaeota archaeon]